MALVAYITLYVQIFYDYGTHFPFTTLNYTLAHLFIDYYLEQWRSKLRGELDCVVVLEYCEIMRLGMTGSIK